MSLENQVAEILGLNEQDIKNRHTYHKFIISKEQLEDLYVNQGLSAFQISKMFNVSEPTVRNRLRKYDIPIRSPNESYSLIYTNHSNLSEKAVEWLNGELLGDGCLQARSKCSALFSYSSKYKEYIKYVSNTLNGFGIKQSGKIHKRVRTQIEKVKFKKPAIDYSYSSLSYAELLFLYKKWYPEGKKIVPKDIELTPLTCRQWHLGDGSLAHPKRWGRPSIDLYTCGFIPEDVEFLVSKLNELGFKCTRQPSSNAIYISPYFTPDFLNYIGKCPVKCYEYKWEI